MEGFAELLNATGLKRDNEIASVSSYSTATTIPLNPAGLRSGNGQKGRPPRGDKVFGAPSKSLSSSQLSTNTFNASSSAVFMPSASFSSLPSPFKRANFAALGYSDPSSSSSDFTNLFKATGRLKPLAPENQVPLRPLRRPRRHAHHSKSQKPGDNGGVEVDLSSSCMSESAFSVVTIPGLGTVTMTPAGMDPHRALTSQRDNTHPDASACMNSRVVTPSALEVSPRAGRRSIDQDALLPSFADCTPASVTPRRALTADALCDPSPAHSIDMIMARPELTLGDLDSPNEVPAPPANAQQSSPNRRQRRHQSKQSISSPLAMRECQGPQQCAIRMSSEAAEPLTDRAASLPADGTGALLSESLMPETSKVLAHEKADLASISISESDAGVDAPAKIPGPPSPATPEKTRKRHRRHSTKPLTPTGEIAPRERAGSIAPTPSEMPVPAVELKTNTAGAAASPELADTHGEMLAGGPADESAKAKKRRRRHSGKVKLDGTSAAAADSENNGDGSPQPAGKSSDDEDAGAMNRKLRRKLRRLSGMKDVHDAAPTTKNASVDSSAKILHTKELDTLPTPDRLDDISSKVSKIRVPGGSKPLSVKPAVIAAQVPAVSVTASVPAGIAVKPRAIVARQPETAAKPVNVAPLHPAVAELMGFF